MCSREEYLVRIRTLLARTIKLKRKTHFFNSRTLQVRMRVGFSH